MATRGIRSRSSRCWLNRNPHQTWTGGDRREMYILAGSEAAGTLDRDDAADGRRVLGGRRSSFSSVVCRPLWRSWFRVQGSLSVVRRQRKAWYCTQVAPAA